MLQRYIDFAGINVDFGREVMEELCVQAAQLCSEETQLKCKIIKDS